MKLLFDENLSRHLIGRLAEQFPDSTHVTEMNLMTATDREVWEFARDNDYVIVSKDSDFDDLTFFHGPPPKVVWLRVGNATTSAIAELLTESAEAIKAFAASKEDAVLIVANPPPPSEATNR